jgi:putative MATE family efflux protein
MSTALSDVRLRRSLDGAILPTLARFAAPNLAQIVLQSAVGLLEIFFVSYLGTDALAGVSLAFPLLLLMFSVAGVALGGGVSAAIARALGAGRIADAEAMARHAVVIALAAGALFSAALLGGGHQLYRALGGAGRALDQAETYSDILFAGAIAIWLVNALTAVLRGTGDMATPARIAFSRAIVVVPLSTLLIFGWGPIPRLGVAGAALATVAHSVLGVIALLVHLRSSRSALRLRWRGALEWQWCSEILRVGGMAALQMVVMNLTLTAVTGLVGRFGVAALAGYGLASRLEMMLLPMLSSLGIASTAMVGMCLGAGQTARARRVTWIAASLGAALLEAAGLLAAAFAAGWIGLFSADADVIAAGAAYLRTVGPLYGFIGLSATLFFASQGWGRMAAPLFVSLLRLALSSGGGWLAVGAIGGGIGALYGTLAFSMAVTGSLLALLVWRRTTPGRSAQ